MTTRGTLGSARRLPRTAWSPTIAGLALEEAPGFDQLSKLRTYFDAEPVTIEELVEFRRADYIDVNGTVVHRLGLSEPLEQVLRKIRARRSAQDAELTDTRHTKLAAVYMASSSETDGAALV